MVQPPYPWPEPPPRNHSRFQPDGLVQDSVSKDSMSLFFCHGLRPKTAAYRIMEAVVRDDHGRLRDLLADPQNLPDFTNDHGVSPVMVAAARGNMISLEILATHPLVNLSRQTPDGWTALHYAAHFNQPLAVTSLLKHYANYTLENTSGEIAFDVAADGVEEAFWAHKDFTRYLKKQRPTHPRFVPKAAEPPAPEAEKTPDAPPPATDRLRLDFVASAARTALTGKNLLREKIMQEITRELPQLTAEEFLACCKTLRRAEDENPKAKKGFDWDYLFIETAKTGRADLIATLAGVQDFDNKKTLNEALYQCIRTGDAPHAVMTLMQLGADPTATAPVKFISGAMDNIIAFKAVEHRRPEAFFQICLWTSKLPHWEKNKEKIQQTMRMWQGRTFERNNPTGTLQTKHKMVLAMQIHDLRRRAHAQSEEDLFYATKHILSPASNLHGQEKTMQLAAIYAETRQSRVHHTFSREVGAQIMVQFLKSGELTLAHRMAQDGFRLTENDATRKLLDATRQSAHSTRSQDVQKFVSAHMNGRLKVYPLKSPEDRMRELQDMAARTPPIAGRGFFGY